MKLKEQRDTHNGYTPSLYIEKIYELVSEGIADTQEVKRTLKHYTLHVLCPEEKRSWTDSDR